MAQVINTNIASLNAQRNLNSSQSSLQTSLQRLSSGLRINSAKDDAAGLAISERFTAQIRGLNQAMRNANDGISFAQTAEGALGEIGNALQRIRELAVQSANDTNSPSDRQAINKEVNALIAEINRIAGSTQFNGQNILDGTMSELVFQVGANRGQAISVTGVDARGAQLGATVATGATVNTEGLTYPANITVQGVAIDLSSAASLDDVVAAINASYGSTGVQAVRADSVETGALSLSATPGAGESFELTINGVKIELSEGEDLDTLRDRINAHAMQTGVTMTEDYTLVSAGDITLEASGDVDLQIAGITDPVTSAKFERGIELMADVGKEIIVGGDANDLAALGLDDLANATETYTVNAISVATREGASNAIRTVDFALQQVAGLRAELGAVQSRFESTIANLSTSSENLSAARSRILDADFAAETANLTRAQILQQAGVAMLAQANALPQNVLSLLR
ncbi:MAG: flagellin [Xanthomonadaceae bacterium]|nr:flagellin [Xanthomonadaceae bacterium]